MKENTVLTDRHNVLIAANYSSLVSGNLIASLVELNNEMIRRGHKALFCFPKSEQILKASWIQWIEREGGKVYLFELNQSTEKQLKDLKRIITDEDIDVLHLHFGMFSNLITKYRKELPEKIIIHERMEYPAGCNKILQTMKYMLQSALFGVKRITFVSVNKQMYYAHPFCKRAFIPNGLALKRNIRESMSRDILRKQLNISNDEKLILLLGWAYYVKGFDIAVGAVAECRKRGHKTILGVIGLDINNEEVKQFVKSKTGIDTSESWIRKLPGGEDIFAYHRSADVYLSASRTEAFSHGVLESISQNTPVVASDIKGTSWCNEYTKSFTYPVEDYLACADAIEKAIEVGRKDSNYQEICEEYSIEKWCDNVIRVYTQ